MLPHIHFLGDCWTEYLKNPKNVGIDAVSISSESSPEKKTLLHFIMKAENGEYKTYPRVIVFSITQEMWEELDIDGRQFLIPNESFSSDDYLFELGKLNESILLHNPAAKVYVLIPPPLYIYQFNLRKISPYPNYKTKAEYKSLSQQYPKLSADLLMEHTENIQSEFQLWFLKKKCPKLVNDVCFVHVRHTFRRFFKPVKKGELIDYEDKDFDCSKALLDGKNPTIDLERKVLYEIYKYIRRRESLDLPSINLYPDEKKPEKKAAQPIIKKPILKINQNVPGLTSTSLLGMPPVPLFGSPATFSNQVVGISSLLAMSGTSALIPGATLPKRTTVTSRLAVGPKQTLLPNPLLKRKKIDEEEPYTNQVHPREKTLVIGDARVKYLKDQTHSSFCDKVDFVALGTAKLLSVADEVERRLAGAQYKNVILFLICFDIATLKYCPLEGVEMLDIQPDFSVAEFFNTMSRIMKKWCLIFPQVRFVWTIPYVPDMIRFNGVRLAGSTNFNSPWIDPDKMCYKVQLFKCYIEGIKTRWRHNDTNSVSLDLNYVMAFGDEKQMEIYDRGALDEVVVCRSEDTVDGLNPSKCFTVKFWPEVNKALIVSANRSRVSLSYPRVEMEDISNTDHSSVNDVDIIDLGSPGRAYSNKGSNFSSRFNKSYSPGSPERPSQPFYHIPSPPLIGSLSSSSYDLLDRTECNEYQSSSIHRFGQKRFCPRLISRSRSRSISRSRSRSRSRSPSSVSAMIRFHVQSEVEKLMPALVKQLTDKVTTNVFRILDAKRKP